MRQRTLSALSKHHFCPQKPTSAPFIGVMKFSFCLVSLAVVQHCFYSSLFLNLSLIFANVCVYN